jgi:hypothetical protein
MSANQPNFAAIGLTFSNETFAVLMEVLRDPKFNFAGEGTMASGYELYVAPDAAQDAIREITTNRLLEGHNVQIYKRVRDYNDGTRYDRLIDHLEGEDPDRPSVNGITFKA